MSGRPRSLEDLYHVMPQSSTFHVASIVDFSGGCRIGRVLARIADCYNKRSMYV